MSFNIVGLAGKKVAVYLEHVIYENQELSISYFNPFQTDEKIGFVVDGHEIYLYHKEIECIECNKNLVKIVGNLQTVIIEVQ